MGYRIKSFGFVLALLATQVLAAPGSTARSSYLNQIGTTIALHPRIVFQAIRGGDTPESREAKVKVVGFAEKSGLEAVKRQEAKFESQVRKSCARDKRSEKQCLEGLDRRKKELAKLEEQFNKPMQPENVATRLYVASVIYLHVAMESVLDPALEKTRMACEKKKPKSEDCVRSVRQITKTAALIEDVSRLAAARAGVLTLESDEPKALEGSIERRLASK